LAISFPCGGVLRHRAGDFRSPDEILNLPMILAEE
jgi:hypothetical protein